MVPKMIFPMNELIEAMCFFSCGLNEFLTILSIIIKYFRYHNPSVTTYKN